MIHAIKKTYLTTGEIGKILHVTRVTVYRWIKQGQLKAVRVHKGKYRVTRKDFAEFLRQHDLHNQVDSEPVTIPTVKILVVDDEPDVIRTIKTFFEKENQHYHVASATSGFEAGQLIVFFMPDVIILNLSMPGMDGFSVCRMIKSNPHTRNIEIIAVTSGSSMENLKEMGKETVRGIFTKPLDYEKLLATVKEMTKLPF